MLISSSRNNIMKLDYLHEARCQTGKRWCNEPDRLFWVGYSKFRSIYLIMEYASDYCMVLVDECSSPVLHMNESVGGK